MAINLEVGHTQSTSYFTMGVIKMLKTKNIHLPSSLEDGRRISIMSRHTKDDGKSPDPKIYKGSYDEWCKPLAPPDHLVGAYYRKIITWQEFERIYLVHIHQVALRAQILRLIQLAHEGTITLLCVKDDPSYCHRSILAQECKRLDPSLEVIIQ